MKTKSYISRLAVAAVILSILAIVFMVFSVKRISTIQSPSFQVCLVQETRPYQAVHILCPVLPAASIMCGVIALLRLRRSGRKRIDAISALGAIVISAGSLVIYWHSLVELVSHSH